MKEKNLFKSLKVMLVKNMSLLEGLDCSTLIAGCMALLDSLKDTEGRENVEDSMLLTPVSESSEPQRQTVAEGAKPRPSISLEHSIHSAGYSEYIVSMGTRIQGLCHKLPAQPGRAGQPSVPRSGASSVGVVDPHTPSFIDVVALCLYLGCDLGLGHYF